MRIQPHENYRLLGVGYGSPALDKTKTYIAQPARCQPDWEEKGKVFVSFSQDGQEPSILLDKFDYDLIQP